MGIAAVIFTILAIPYKYVETEEEKKKKLEDAEEEKKKLSIDSNSSISSSEDEKNEKKAEGVDNEAFQAPSTEPWFIRALKNIHAVKFIANYLLSILQS